MYILVELLQLDREAIVSFNGVKGFGKDTTLYFSEASN